MEWINAVFLIVLVILLVQQRQQVTALERHLNVHTDRMTMKIDGLSVQGELAGPLESVLAAHKELLGSHKELLDSMKAAPEAPAARLPEEEKEAGGLNEQRQRRILAEEKERFGNEVREKKRTVEWYEKEFSIGLEALMELFLHVPVDVQEAVVSRMPNSVMKKGFTRLSEKIVEPRH